MLSSSKIKYSCVNILEENPIDLAVSTLSPVRTQNLIPTFVKASIHSATPSLKLSSKAIDPSKNKLSSILI